MEKNTADSTNAGHELSEVDIRGIAWSGAGLAAGTIVVCFFVYFLLRFMTTIHPIAQAPLHPPPEPRLQEHPWEEYQNLKTSELNQLHSYQWVNKRDGVVRIPIDRAMDLLLERGLPTRKDSDVKK